MKKRFLIAASAIVAVSAGVFAYLNSESKADDFFEANVEALARDEAYITWNCTGSPLKTCAQTCGICGSSISGTGNLTGIHKCSN